MSILSVITDKSGGGAQAISKLLTKDVFQENSKEVVLFNDTQSKNIFGKLAKWITAAIQLRKVITSSKEHSPTVITHLHGALYLMTIVRFFCHTRKWIHLVHGPSTPPQSTSAVYSNFFLSLGLRFTDHVCFVSSTQREIYLQQFNFLKHKPTSIIRNPYIKSSIKTKIEDILHIRYFKKNGYFLLIVPGRLDKQKNQRFAINVFHELKQRKILCKLLLAGNGRDYNELVSFTRYLGLKYSNSFDDKSDVFFLGHRNDVQNLMLLSDAILLPSIYEGFPLALVEAVCLGTPVIASDCMTGPSEIYQILKKLSQYYQFDTNTQMMLMTASFTPYDIKEWANCLENIFQSNAKRIHPAPQIINEFDIQQYKVKWNSIIS